MLARNDVLKKECSMAEQRRLFLPQDGTVPLEKISLAFAREIFPLKEKERSPAVAELRSLNPHRLLRVME